MDDQYYMRRALQLAKRGLGRTSPNPMVGAVIVRDGSIIGEGYHRRYGGKHAEVEALEAARGEVEGATLYVNLEPCCHRNKKTPPCLEAILARRFGRVVVGTLDPNPAVKGGSVAELQRHGIETVVGVLSEQCERLNEVFFTYMRRGTPYVTLKWAQTLDGRIATPSGDSRWISSQPSLRLAHRLRSIHDAVLVGAGTVVADDPELTVRLTKGRNPVRVVLDSTLRTPLEARLIRDSAGAKIILATTDRVHSARVEGFRGLGAEVVVVGSDCSGRVSLHELLEALGRRGISSILVEGGSAVAASFLGADLWDRLVAILSPKFVGSGTGAVGDLGITAMEDALQFRFEGVRRSGNDVVLEARPGR